MKQVIVVRSIIDGPMQIDGNGYTLLCLIDTKDGLVSTDEIKGLTLDEALILKECVAVYGPQEVEATWVGVDEDAV